MQAAQYNRLAALEGRPTRDIWTGKIKTSDFGRRLKTVIGTDPLILNGVGDKTSGEFAGNKIGVYDGAVIENPGSMTKFGIPKHHVYNSNGIRIFIHPHALKHLEELGTNAAKLGTEYQHLIGELYQESIHRAIDDVLQQGPLKYRYMYNTSGNKLMFDPPRSEGLFPVLIHFR